MSEKLIMSEDANYQFDGIFFRFQVNFYGIYTHNCIAWQSPGNMQM